MDRKQAPTIRTIKSLEILPPQHQSLPNGGTLFHLSEVEDEAVKVDLIFDAGTGKHDKLICKLTGALLLGGTDDKSSHEINEAIDQLGGFTNIEVSTDEAVVSVLGLKEHITSLVRIVADAIMNANFDTREINQLVAEKKQRFSVEIEKVGTLARRAFLRRAFPDSPHGNLTQLEDFENVDRNDLVKFHKENYQGSLQKIAIVGNLEQSTIDEIKEINSAFGYQDLQKSKFDYTYTPEKISLEKEGALQSAIRIGRILFNKHHEDFIDFSILNTILGGYFGSRLMTSIREEKGYTYGIGSGVAQMVDTGYFFISTEVGSEYREDTLIAIKEEIDRLQNELINPEELDKVRNYVTGQLLKNADGPFAQMERFLSVEKYGLDLSYYDVVLDHLNSVTPERLRSLAQTYLKWEDMIIVSAG